MLMIPKFPYVRFETEVAESKDEEGHATYKNRYMAYITPCGGRDEVLKVAEDWIKELRDKAHSRSAFDSSAEEYTKWYEHFSRHFDLYKNGEEMLCAGTPIRACLGFTKAEVAQAEKVNLFSIEDLAGCNEEALGYMGVGSRSLKIKAQEILKTQQTTRPAEEFAALHTQIEQLQADLKELREANKAANTKDRTLHIK